MHLVPLQEPLLGLKDTPLNCPREVEGCVWSGEATLILTQLFRLCQVVKWEDVTVPQRVGLRGR